MNNNTFDISMAPVKLYYSATEAGYFGKVFICHNGVEFTSTNEEEYKNPFFPDKILVGNATQNDIWYARQRPPTDQETQAYNKAMKKIRHQREA